MRLNGSEGTQPWVQSTHSEALSRREEFYSLLQWGSAVGADRQQHRTSWGSASLCPASTASVRPSLLPSLFLSFPFLFPLSFPLSFSLSSPFLFPLLSLPCAGERLELLLRCGNSANSPEALWCGCGSGAMAQRAPGAEAAALTLRAARTCAGHDRRKAESLQGQKTTRQRIAARSSLREAPHGRPARSLAGTNVQQGGPGPPTAFSGQISQPGVAGPSPRRPPPGPKPRTDGPQPPPPPPPAPPRPPRAPSPPRST